jgi:hypothetical protein
LGRNLIVKFIQAENHAIAYRNFMVKTKTVRIEGSAGSHGGPLGLAGA